VLGFFPRPSGCALLVILSRLLRAWLADSPEVHMTRCVLACVELETNVSVCQKQFYRHDSGVRRGLAMGSHRRGTRCSRRRLPTARRASSRCPIFYPGGHFNSETAVEVKRSLRLRNPGKSRRCHARTGASLCWGLGMPGNAAVIEL
jgi:hypothetical protein